MPVDPKQEARAEVRKAQAEFERAQEHAARTGEGGRDSPKEV